MICPLCKTNPSSENSHIIPAFVFRWLKKTSATGHMRNVVNINRRVQDGLKYALLCGQCEDRFSIYEGVFAKTVFHPYAERKMQTIPYDENCLKFSVSLLWRALHHLWLADSHSDEPLQPEFDGRLTDPYQVWADFLLDKAPHPGRFTVNVFPVDDLASVTLPTPPKGLSQYYTGAVDMDLVCSPRCGYVYAKIPHFLFWGCVFLRGREYFSKNTLIRVRRGTLGGPTMQMPQDLARYILNRCDLIDAKKSEMSEAQREVLQKTLDRDLGRVQESRSLKSALADHQVENKS